MAPVFGDSCPERGEKRIRLPRMKGFGPGLLRYVGTYVLSVCIVLTKEIIDREPIECTQDQWDIYKLDPEYDCLVQFSPKLPIITKAEFKPKYSPAPPIAPRPGKRPASTSPTPTSKRARQRSITPLSSHSSESEESVNDMLVDEKPLRKRWRSTQLGLGPKLQTVRDKIEENRKIRREDIKRFQAKRDLGVEDNERMFSPIAETATKRKGGACFLCSHFLTYSGDVVSTLDSSTRPIRSLARLQEDPILRHASGPFKKQKRTTSPIRPINLLSKRESRRTKQERVKQKRWAKVMERRKMYVEQEFMNEILEDVPEGIFAGPGASNGKTFTGTDAFASLLLNII